MLLRQMKDQDVRKSLTVEITVKDFCVLNN